LHPKNLTRFADVEHDMAGTRDVRFFRISGVNPVLPIVQTFEQEKLRRFRYDYLDEKAIHTGANDESLSARFFLLQGSHMCFCKIANVNPVAHLAGGRRCLSRNGVLKQGRD
jgi:hypothetical protein